MRSLQLCGCAENTPGGVQCQAKRGECRVVLRRVAAYRGVIGGNATISAKAMVFSPTVPCCGGNGVATLYFVASFQKMGAKCVHGSVDEYKFERDNGHDGI